MFDIYQAIQAAHDLGPATYHTSRGVQVSADETNFKLPEPGSVLGRSHIRIAWKSYLPSEPAHHSAILFIPGEYLSGGVYDQAAQRLAEQRIPSYALSLGNQGLGYWKSYDSLEAGKVTLERLVKYHVGPVVAEIRRRKSQVILAGDGLGGIIAQLYARQDTDVRGLILLGSCSPRWAASVWKPEKRWSRQSRMPESLSLDDVRRLFLHPNTPDQEVFDLWQVILTGRAYPPIRREFRTLAHTSVPSVSALVIFGANDCVIPEKVRNATAREYGTQPVILQAAPHLVAWGSSPELSDHIIRFCEAAQGKER
jgi:pimeloyl-ACP methyl ester carboxylesterase